ncbi:inosine-5-monophosphate dehydrogenase [bacterium]|nr:inosine-5-monophosphate dehydrogenase [bacterium]
MKTVREILLNKGNQVWSVSPDTTVFAALQLMAEKNTGALLVMKDNKVAGILTERDYARKVVLLGKLSKDTLVQEIMSSTIFYVEPSYSTEECMALMIDKRVRHLPVIEKEKLEGIISIGDVVKAVIDEKEFLISQLEHYIKGERG